MRGLLCFCIAVTISALVWVTAPEVGWAFAPTIVHPSERDIDINGIEDALEARVAEAIDSGQPEMAVRVTVTLYSPPTKAELTLFRQMGGDLRFTYEHATYGFAGVLPAVRITDLAEGLGDRLCIIEADVPGSGTLDDSARQSRVRAIVWNPSTGYGLDGNADITIAIFDTGIDVTHTDLSGGRLVFWHDFTTESEPVSTDRNGHGSHVTGIAAGTGAALGSGAVSTLTTTMSGRLPTTNGYGYVDMIKVPVLGSGQVTSNLTWQGTGTGQINLATSGGSWLGGYTSASPPLSHTWTIGSTDVYKARAGNHSGLGGQAYSMLVTYPYTSVGDGFNLFRGMAPACKLACPKILYQNNSGWASEWTAAFDSVAAINSLFNIKVANASVGLNDGATNLALRTAVDGLVSAGTVVTISAGNDYPTYRIPDPGLAEKAITVGSINDFGAMTDYSSNGPVGSVKPDVVAPGGSHSWDSNVGSEITSIDTNVNDAYKTGFADRQANDYTNMYGTSMAAPCAAGLAALMIDAQEQTQGYPWGYNEYEALRIKMLMQMTATETNKLGEESCGNNPALNRGGKDRVEGFGKINGDAAVEAIIRSFMVPPDTSVSFSFGAGVFGRKCWASELIVCGPDTIVISMDVPAGADYDLYIYHPYGVAGEPQISYSSTLAGSGVDEEIRLSVGHVCAFFYLVAKRVSGSGTAVIDLERSEASIAAGGGELQVPIFGQNHPNPFSHGTAIPYSVPGRGQQPVTLKIYDARGALVRTLVQSNLGAGTHRAFWDGKDARGRLVAPGVYFAKLDVSGVTRTMRMTVIR